MHEIEFIVPDVAVGGKRSPYIGGVFRVCASSVRAFRRGSLLSVADQAEIVFPLQYPAHPPFVRLLTPVLHPTVLPNGRVGARD